MQRVAALYDIHGNLPALEAVLDDMRRSGVEHLIVGGDVVPGPMSRAVIERLLALEIPAQFITGNGESAVLKQMTGRSGTAHFAPSAAGKAQPSDPAALR